MNPEKTKQKDTSEKTRPIDPIKMWFKMRPREDFENLHLKNPEHKLLRCPSPSDRHKQIDAAFDKLKQNWNQNKTKEG